MKRAAFFIPIALALLIVSIAAAQTGGGYDLSWNTSDGGGGTATGSGYRIDHTLGQVDAGTQSGGGYTLNGGFWSGVDSGAAPTPGQHRHQPRRRHPPRRQRQRQHRRRPPRRP